MYKESLCKIVVMFRKNVLTDIEENCKTHAFENFRKLPIFDKEFFAKNWPKWIMVKVNFKVIFQNLYLKRIPMYSHWIKKSTLNKAMGIAHLKNDSKLPTIFRNYHFVSIFRRYLENRLIFGIRSLDVVISSWIRQYSQNFTWIFW